MHRTTVGVQSWAVGGQPWCFRGNTTSFHLFKASSLFLVNSTGWLIRIQKPVSRGHSEDWVSESLSSSSLAALVIPFTATAFSFISLTSASTLPSADETVPQHGGHHNSLPASLPSSQLCLHKERDCSSCSQDKYLKEEGKDQAVYGPLPSLQSSHFCLYKH